jgi:hypothetical protein
MANLADTAQMTMDLYYQNFKTDEDFFNLTHFLYLSGVAYSKLLEDEYKEARKEAKMEDSFAEIFIQADWLIEQTIEMKRIEDEDNSFSGTLSSPLFSFPYDPYSFGIQSVRRAGKTKCNHFIRTTGRESWLDCQLPTTNRVFFHVIANKLIVNNVQCAMEKLIVQMVPEITDLMAFGMQGGPVPKSKEDIIIRKTLELMMAARNGAVVDMTNNSNPNKTLQTEVDSAFSNLLRPSR